MTVEQHISKIRSLDGSLIQAVKRVEDLQAALTGAENERLRLRAELNMANNALLLHVLTMEPEPAAAGAATQ